MSHEWGNYPDCEENNAPKMYWGARALIERVNGKKTLCLLPDRQSFERLEGSKASKDDFVHWIDDYVLPELRKFTTSGCFNVWDDKVVLVSEDKRFVCKATPKNSCGAYLYIGAWEL